MSHQPVLLNEVLTFLDPHPGDFVIDGTVGGGGHASAIIPKIMPNGMLFGLDWDEQALEKCRLRLGEHDGVMLAHGNYADLPAILQKKDLGKADALLVDLGFSSDQLESSGRGFAFSEAAEREPLIMTYDKSRVPVAEILREISEKELAEVIFRFGGERFSRRIAKAIKEHAKRKPIVTSGELAEIVRKAVPKNYEHGRIDPATRTYQALRIYANGELENLETLLVNLQNIVKPGGRVAIISFHSLEDGIVKRAFQALLKKAGGILLTKKPVVPSREEKKENPRSRSAKLRVMRLL